LEQIDKYIRAVFAASVELKEEEVFGENLTLAQVMSRSGKLHNSVDLMEAFARTANGVKRDYGVKIRLPAFPLETAISEVLASFLSEIKKSSSEKSIQGSDVQSL